MRHIRKSIILFFLLGFSAFLFSCDGGNGGTTGPNNGGTTGPNDGGSDGSPPQLVSVETSQGGVVDFKFNEDMMVNGNYSVTTCPNNAIGWIDKRTFRIIASAPPGQQCQYVLNPKEYSVGFRDASGEPLPETKGTFIVK